MTTKSEMFRYKQERSGPKKAKQPPYHHGRDDGQPAATHNESARAGKHAGYALETTSGTKPSRKSSRKAANRQKNDVQFRMKRKTAEARPQDASAMR